MKKILFTAAIALLAAGKTFAQPYYTLQAAIDTALARNIGVRQNGLLAEQAEVNMKQARANLLPDLTASLDHGLNQGRSIDPFSNAFVNQSINYAGYGLSSGVVLFNGGNLQNTVKQFATAYDASRMELKQAKDNLTLNVILAYLQVLNTEDMVVAAIRQREVSEEQLKRLQVLDEKGAISPSQVTDVRGQLMNDELNIINLRNTLETAKLSLAQLMNVPYRNTMKLERINADEFLSDYSLTSDDVYQSALQQFSLVKSVELRRKSAEYGVKAARGRLFPTVVLGGNTQTNYSSVAQDANGKIKYNDQLANNLFYTVNLGVRIPIFGNFRARNNIKLADINMRNTQLVEENTKMQLRQQIEQAHLNMTNTYERYKALVNQVAAYNISFKAAEARLTAGVGTTVDYVLAKANLDRANIALISAKYDFVLRKKVLDFYQNIQR
jgi:outer membrane protein